MLLIPPIIPSLTRMRGNLGVHGGLERSRLFWSEIFDAIRRHPSGPDHEPARTHSCVLGVGGKSWSIGDYRAAP